MIKIPPGFNKAFLAWLRETTEARWRRLEGETDGWQPGTRWTGGISLAELEQAERLAGQTFPPDYRLFLTTLGSTSPGLLVPSQVEHSMETLVEIPGFLDWRKDKEDIVTRIEDVASGIWWDVEVNVHTPADAKEAVCKGRDESRPPAFWFSSWGDCPASTNQRRRRIEQIVDAAPRLIPIIGNRYLLNAANESGNPVLSVHQTDILYWADSLRDFLLRDLAVVLPAASRPQGPPVGDVRAMPFWGELVN
jgi:hypothetical protein